MIKPKEPNTLLGRAMAEQDEAGGRFANLAPRIVTGAEPIPRVPALPPSSPWHHDPTPPERPLGIDINAVPKIGMEIRLPDPEGADDD
jgi:hypothetical protein